MELDKYLEFLTEIGKNKPNNIKSNNGCKCPFCDRKNLTDIIREEGPFVLLKNKYPTLKNTLQLVIIETYNCKGNMSDYDDEYIKKLILFGIEEWLKLEKSLLYRSVIFYKNHGPNSGGSLRHPHMQIVGLNEIDYRLGLKEEYFEGISIYKNDYCEVNFSDKPYNSFSEFNIIIDDNLSGIYDMAISIKKITSYILNDYFAKCDSFNIFFYHWNNKIICKITPRFITSPLLLGYSIRQLPSIKEDIAEKIKNLYFN